MFKTTKVGLVDGLVDGLAESQEQIIKLIAENPKVSKVEMAMKIGISSTAIDKNIAVLKKKGVIERVGSDRSRYWKILK
ncbi:winged helix-turn-helix transcriptional regulator [Algoriphagus taiwanensis]|uniref:winged helix-turn-helix transcriptional regulator n=1 Tax=Algoriphagus taiwanensis TaxID=1445656 RepID=UPI0030C6B3A7